MHNAEYYCSSTSADSEFQVRGNTSLLHSSQGDLFNKHLRSDFYVPGIGEAFYSNKLT